MTHFVINTLMLEHIVDEILVGIFLLGINDPMDAVEIINCQFGTLILCSLKFGLARLAILEGNGANNFLLVFVLFEVIPYPTRLGCLGRSGVD